MSFSSRARAVAVRVVLGAAGAAALAAAGAPAPAGAATLAESSKPTAVYAVDTNVLYPLKPMAVEYSQGVFFRYPVGIDINAFTKGLTVSPSVPFSVSFASLTFAAPSNRAANVPQNGGPAIYLRYQPGVVYTLTQPAFGISMKVASPSITSASIPAPYRKVTNSPYYYGFLDHPWLTNGFLGPLQYTGNAMSPAQKSSKQEAQQVVNMIAQSGAGFIRLDYCGDMSIGHTAPYSTADFTTYDAIINALAAVHVTVMPVILQYCAPPYTLVNPSGDPSQTYSTPAYFAQVAGALAKHLLQFPQVSRVELFNEPNLTHNWLPGTSAYVNNNGTGQAPFMQAAYAAIKKANPKMMVVAAGLSNGGPHVDSRTFIANAYTAGCRTGVCWDELSVHNYRWTAPGSALIANDPKEENRFDVYKDLQNVATSHGDAKPKVMLTEWGYSTCPASTQCFDPLVQALYEAQGLNLALADPSVDGITWVNVFNPVSDGPSYFWSSSALVAPNMAAKQAYSVYAAFAKGSH